MEDTYADPSEFGWNGSIDPVLGTYKPDLDPAGYTIQVTDHNGNVVSNARISMAGEWFYPNEAGRFVVESGPAVFSPLVVQLLNSETGEYEEVLRFAAYYPIPDRINSIRLEPMPEEMTFSLLSEDGLSSEGGISWGGIPVKILGKETKMFWQDGTINAITEKFGVSLKDYRLPNGNLYTAISTEVKFQESGINKLLDKLKPGSKKLNLMGIDFNFGVKGFSERSFDMDKLRWVMVREQYGLFIGGSKDFVYQIPALAGLVYGRCSLSVSGEGLLGSEREALDDSTENVVTRFDGDVTLEGGLQLALGAGVHAANFYLEGGGEGVLEISWDLPHVSAAESLSAQINFRGFVKSGFFFTGGEASTPTGTFKLWPRDETSRSLLSLETEYSMLPRNYLKQMQTMSTGDSDSEYFYPYGRLQLVKLSNGRYVMLYTTDDAARGDADRSVLQARIGTITDGKIVWGDAITVDPDGTGDYAFNACAKGTEVALVWQDMDTKFGNEDDYELAEIAAHVQLSQAVLDCSGTLTQVRRIAEISTGDGLSETMPVIYYNGGDTVRCAWFTASELDPTAFDESTRYTVWLCEGFGEDAAVRAVASDQNSITGLALVSSDLMWSSLTEDGSDLWVCDPTGTVTCARESGVMNLQSVGNTYIYTVGQDRFGGSGSYSAGKQQSHSEANTNVLRLSATGDVCYADLGLDTTTLYRFNGESASQVAEFEGYLSSWDMAGDHIVTLLRPDLENDPETAILSTGTVTSKSEILVEFSCELPYVEKYNYLYLTVTVHNNGTSSLKDPVARITLEDGTLLATKELYGTIAAGSSATHRFGIYIDKVLDPQTLTATVKGVSDTIYINGSNIKLFADWESGYGNRVRAVVRSLGFEAVEGVVTFTDADGAVLGSKPVMLDPKDTEVVWMDLGSAPTEPTVINVTLTESGAHGDPDDNEASVTVYPTQGQLVHVAPYLHVGQDRQQAVTIFTTPANCAVPDLSYAVEDPAIASVDQNGIVTGHSVGETTLTVSAADGAEFKVTVLVSDGDDGFAD